MYRRLQKVVNSRPCFLGIILFFSACAAGSVLADEPVPITANSAFDAFATQTDPCSGDPMAVALVDVRSRAEYFWVGTATQVDEIILKDGSSIVPDLGKVVLDHEGKFLTYTLNWENRRLQVRKVAEIIHSPIALNIPFKLWDESTATLVGNPDFKDAIEDLALSGGIEVVILYCRSGGRSSKCYEGVNNALFAGVYEIDDPGDENHGGFEGNSYGNVYNGYRGFPGRQTSVQRIPSVSWKDAGLPMKTSINPLK